VLWITEYLKEFCNCYLNIYSEYNSENGISLGLEYSEELIDRTIFCTKPITAFYELSVITIGLEAI